MPIFNEKVKQEIINFLSIRLTIPQDGVWCHYYDEGYENDEWLEDFAADQGADTYAHGCTKIVLFYKELPDWVIKIPFLGEYNEDEDFFTEFEGANSHFPIDKGNDYCAGEVYITNLAKNFGIDNMFAKTYFLDYFNNYPVYVSEKIVNDFFCYPDFKDGITSRAIAEDIQCVCSHQLEESCLNEKALPYFVDIYGEEETYELLYFIDKEGITDLHLGNIGFTKDLKIKLIDYSGFNS